jgi:23S rRNA (pseudouridine1915-N3)-methyltransferase
MKITLMVMGKTDAEWLQQGIEVYAKRLGFYLNFEIRVVPDIRNARNLSAADYRDKEGEMMLPLLENKKEIYLLEEKGKEYSSRDLARFIERRMVTGSRELLFIIGGPYGFSDKITEKASGKISLSKLTFSHQMVRLLFLEQLYRAFTIINGEPYHHD